MYSISKELKDYFNVLEPEYPNWLDEYISVVNPVSVSLVFLQYTLSPMLDNVISVPNVYVAQLLQSALVSITVDVAYSHLFSLTLLPAVLAVKHR